MCEELRGEETGGARSVREENGRRQMQCAAVHGHGRNAPQTRWPGGIAISQHLLAACKSSK
eukprot:2902545-Prymnesium_polylepis.2